MKHTLTRRLLMAAGLLTLVACSTAISVKGGDSTEFASKSYQSYAWEKAPIEPGDTQSDKVYQLDHFLRAAVDSELQSLGYQPVDPAKADFLIAYRYYVTTVADQGGIVSPSIEQAAAWDMGDDTNQTEIYHHYIPPSLNHGNLELLFVDRAANDTVWQAKGHKIIENDQADPSVMKARAERLAKKLLTEVPARR